MPRPWKHAAAVAFALVAGVAAATLADAPGSAGPVDGPRAGAQRPNIVLVMTDDQNDYELRWMPRTRAALRDGGLEFVDAISPHPLCCPARAELVTGQYAQNNGVRHNNGPYGGFDALAPDRNLGSWFQQAGYETGFVGKYLTKYGDSDGAQPGWSRWEALVRGVYSYTDFSFTDDRTRTGEARYRDSYVTEVIEQRTNDLVRDYSASGRPFLLMSWHLAPHYRFDEEGRPAPPASARQDRDRFARLEPPSLAKPSFSERRVVDQPTVFARRKERRRAPVREEFRARVRSLAAVDRAVASLVETLRETGEWRNTYLFFTSDNGYLLGEHRFIGKNVLAEEALQVPLLVAGPGVEPGSTSESPVSLVDLPATFAELAGVTPQRLQDGQSLVPALRGGAEPFRDTTLVQTGRSLGDGWDQRGVRTDRYLFGVREDGSQAVLYDTARDPFQLVNRALDPAYAAVRSELELRRLELLDCAGAACNRIFGPVPEPTA